MQFTYESAVKYIEGFIGTSPTDRAGYKLDRIAHLAGLAGNPQDKLRIIHIAATSGKGSTTTLIADILGKHGLKVGSSLSPHILDIRERFQINSKLISAEKFFTYLSKFKDFVEECSNSSYGKPTYYEFLMAFAYYVFACENVDFAIIETGCGGLLDGSNIAKRQDKICVLGSIGYDHMHILGNTLGEIAAQKAGIVHSGNRVVALKQSDEINDAFTSQSPSVINWIECTAESKVKGKNIFDFSYKNFEINNLEVGLHGEYQIINTSLAIAACVEAAHIYKFDLNADKVAQAVRDCRLVGRFDRQEINGKVVILDGAHNLQKMHALVQTMTNDFPVQKFDILIGLKEGKELQTEMLKLLVPIADSFTCTGFLQEQDFKNISLDPQVIAQTLAELGGKDVTSIDVPSDAFAYAFKKKNVLLVTGSMYLLAEIYKLLPAKT